MSETHAVFVIKGVTAGIQAAQNLADQSEDAIKEIKLDSYPLKT